MKKIKKFFRIMLGFGILLLILDLIVMFIGSIFFFGNTIPHWLAMISVVIFSFAIISLFISLLLDFKKILFDIHSH